MTIRAVIFDFGGVLFRTRDPRAQLKWAERLGRSVRELAKAVYYSDVARRVEVGQAPVSAIWEHVADTLDLSDEEVEVFQEEFWSGDRLDEELAEFLRGLRPRYRTAILSNAWPDSRRFFGEAFGMSDAVDEMIISAEEGVAKPDPRIFQIALDRLDVRPEEAVFVDDMPHNVEGARALGMHGVRFESTAQVISAVRRLLDEQIEG